MNVPKWAVFLVGLQVGILVGAEVYHLTMGGVGRYQVGPQNTIGLVLDTKTGAVKLMSCYSEGLPFDKVDSSGERLTTQHTGTVPAPAAVPAPAPVPPDEPPRQ